jgi:two-component system OmpR family sensor kinase
MSLRARLLAVLLLAAALGLIVLAAVTYAEQRSFLYQRVDDQAQAALPAVRHALEPDQQFPGPPGRGGGGPDFAPFNLQSGIYGELRTSTGVTVRKGFLLAYGQSAPAVPKLPDTVPTDHPITVDSSGGTHYRVIAFPSRDFSGSTIVALPLNEVDRTLNRLLLVEALVIGGVLTVLALVAWWLVRLGLRPLDRMGATADAIAAGDLSRRVEPANERTEVGRLGLALNAMLAQIERAFGERHASESRLRRFLADASHELRTPLSSIRGYAELFRIGATRDPGETEKAMSRIEDESARMGRLVEDMLTLARLDQLPESALVPVDLTALARDAVDDARAAAPDRHISVTAPDAEVIVLGDQSQLRQVIGNLVRNALVHTPPGTPVELRVAPDHGEGVIEVRDHGPGLPTSDVEALFERFWRADPGRGRGPAGAGLGLSIVAALVEAHGGSVQASNAPGGGASFVVRLPAPSEPSGSAQMPASALPEASPHDAGGDSDPGLQRGGRPGAIGPPAP